MQMRVWASLEYLGIGGNYGFLWNSFWIKELYSDMYDKEFPIWGYPLSRDIFFLTPYGTYQGHGDNMRTGRLLPLMWIHVYLIDEYEALGKSPAGEN